MKKSRYSHCRIISIFKQAGDTDALVPELCRE